MNRRTVRTAGWAGMICMLIFALSGCNLGSVINSAPAGQSSGGHGFFRFYDDFPLGRPVDFQAFKDRYQTVGASPEGAVRMYFDAVYSYIDPKRNAEGAKMLRYSLHERQGWENFPSQQTFVSRLKNPSYHHIFRSYAEGTSPENSYAMDPDNYRLMFENAQQMADFVRVSIRSTGADSARGVRVQQFEDGLWYVTECSSTYVEVRQPANQRRTGGHDADRD